MGSALQAVSGWSTSVSSSSLVYDGGTVPQFIESGVIDWVGGTTGSKLSIGTWSGALIIPNVNEAPVYLLDQPTAVSIYAQTGSGSASVTLQGLGVTTGGASTVTGTSATATLSNAGWTRLTSFVPTGSTVPLYVLPLLTCNTASAPVIRICCLDLQYGVSAAANNLQPWVLGYGSPRVVVLPSTTGGAFPAVSRLIPFRDHTLMLGEV